MSQVIKESLQKIHVPSFDEFNAVNESVETEMGHYTQIVNAVDELKEIYGEKEVAKTGVLKTLENINKLILTGKRQEAQAQESQPAQEETQPAQDYAQEDLPAQEEAQL